MKIGNLDFNGGYIGEASITKCYVGNALVWERGEKRLEYISNGGTSGATRNVCFDTGVEPSFDLTFEVRFSSEHLNGTQAIAACADAVSTYFQILAPRGDRGYSLQSYLNQADSPYRVMTADIHTIRAYNLNNHNVCEVDGTAYTATGTRKTLPEAGIAMGLFARRTATGFGVNCYGNTKIYYFKVWDGSTLLHDFEPYLKNGIPCFKDLVTGIYIYNIGVDTPVAGPEWQMPNDEIWYTSTDNSAITPYNTTGWTANIVSNTYSGGKGVIKFDGDITSVPDKAFEYCFELTSIELPNSVTSIGFNAFVGCTALTSIELPSLLTSIGIYAFDYCSSLASITIPSGVTYIGGDAFNHCSSLASITIPSGVTEIKFYTFHDCTSLTSIKLPSLLTHIGSWAFEACSSLASITIPSGVTYINSGAFSGCTSLTSITCLPTTPCRLGDTNVFDGIANNGKIYVPAASVNAYKSAQYWSDYASIIEAIPE